MYARSLLTLPHLLIGLIVMLATCGSATAGVLTSLSHPKIVSKGIEVSYQHAPGDFNRFLANGFAFKLDTGLGTSERIRNALGGHAGTFALEAFIDKAGSLSGGTLEISGSMAERTTGYQPLLIAKLTDLRVVFGDDMGTPTPHDDRPDLFQFRFELIKEQSALAGLYGPSGLVSLSVKSPLNGSFDNFFISKRGSNFAATQPLSQPLSGHVTTPEPGTVVVWGFLLATGLMRYRRR